MTISLTNSGICTDKLENPSPPSLKGDGQDYGGKF